MARVKRGVVAHARHKKVLKLAKGYKGARSKVFRVAKQAVIKAGQYAYIGRKQRKRQFRSLWITKINAAARLNNMSYSQLMNQLKKSDITINRKMLADLAVNNAENFAAIVNSIASQK
ncbi:MAG: 50S ribosomal protein L20 [Gammaproteobacteria bacterium]|jgi:large subunit ribosomal protein L20|nr:50S ribosomal protein L20 [Gammaproteobacteria bacterium]MBT5406320.1 50S ribosomal protein L20 [Gammaproteobacteria bacterium]MBT5644421.1 50S ribosomal protein L20 [Gammaproteobacteria bacterium]MBT5863841.1 50S ribosomal protein L20 [Gammaproteobacteria bacterium]MBT6734701.1 50S ribosomal protein L20 [Gammaproteobacteria bacterium]|tara:strand:+ start:2752 stop:3105 length:354 start_codon:yes stop_codon:yes gene_type:complete